MNKMFKEALKIIFEDLETAKKDNNYEEIETITFSDLVNKAELYKKYEALETTIKVLNNMYGDLK